MENVNFTVLSHLGNSLLLVHNDDSPKLLKDNGSPAIVKGMQVDLSDGLIYGPETILEWTKFIPFEGVEEGTQEMYIALIERKISDEVIANLIEVLEQIKLPSDGGE